MVCVAESRSGTGALTADSVAQELEALSAALQQEQAASGKLLQSKVEIKN